MPSVSLPTLISRVRTLTDTQNTNAVSDAEITVFINTALATLRDIIIGADEDFEISSQSYTSTGSEFFDLPADFYQLRGVDYVVSSTESHTLTPFSFTERNKNRNVNALYRFNTFSSYSYHLVGTQLQIIPTPASGVAFKMWYIPNYTALSGSDTFNFYNGWDEFVVMDAAIKVATKVEDDPSPFIRERTVHATRIKSAATSRNHSISETVTDIYYVNDDWNLR